MVGSFSMKFCVCTPLRACSTESTDGRVLCCIKIICLKYSDTISEAIQQS